MKNFNWLITFGLLKKAEEKASRSDRCISPAAILRDGGEGDGGEVHFLGFEEMPETGKSG